MSSENLLVTIILASASAVRGEILRNAGLDFDIVPADIDEDRVKTEMKAEGSSASETAQVLADLKAQKVSKEETGALVIGADQMLVCEGSWFDKPNDLEAARDQLMKLRGKRHQLLSSVSVAQHGEVIFRHSTNSSLTMRSFSESFLDSYLKAEAENVCKTVGGYRLEGGGIQLFTSLKGSYFDILGLPLLPLLTFLRTKEILGD
jgi:septum formation protein